MRHIVRQASLSVTRRRRHVAAVRSPAGSPADPNRRSAPPRPGPTRHRPPTGPRPAPARLARGDPLADGVLHPHQGLGHPGRIAAAALRDVWSAAPATASTFAASRTRSPAITPQRRASFRGDDDQRAILSHTGHSDHRRTVAGSRPRTSRARVRRSSAPACRSWVTTLTPARRADAPPARRPPSTCPARNRSISFCASRSWAGRPPSPLHQPPGGRRDVGQRLEPAHARERRTYASPHQGLHRR
jgi:hypothetical protein